MTKKINVVNSSNYNSYRIIINITDDISMGVVLNSSELNELYYNLKDIIDNKHRTNNTNTNEEPNETVIMELT